MCLSVLECQIGIYCSPQIGEVMNIERTIQVSPILSAQRTAAQLETTLVKLANDQIKTDGQAVMQLIQSVPKATGNIGNTINVSV